MSPSFILLNVISFFPHRSYVILLHISNDRSNWFYLSFSSTITRNFPGISDLSFEVSKFRHHYTLCFKFHSFFPTFKSNLLVKTFFLFNAAFLHFWNSFHLFILHHLFSVYPDIWNIPQSPALLMYHNHYWGWLFLRSFLPTLFSN
jgi:hypothetical protein